MNVWREVLQGTIKNLNNADTTVSKRNPCNTRLLQKVKCKNGFKLLPVKVYHLKTSFEQLVKRIY